MPPPNRRRLSAGREAIITALVDYFGSWLPAAIVMLVILVAIIVLI